MDSVSSVGTFTEKIQTSQPSLTKRGLALQDKSVNLSSGAKKVGTHVTAPPPQTPQGNAIDIKI